MATIKLANKTIAPGTREIIDIHVTKDLGFDVSIKAHVLAGKKEGPTLLLLSTLHGHEWFSVLIFKELVKRCNLNDLSGNIILVPVANPAAFNTGTRCILDNSDEPDANRAFNGKYQWLSNQLTRVIEEEFISKADYMIDFHIGDWGCTMADIGYLDDPGDPENTLVSKGMALSYQFPIIHNMFSQKGKSNRSSTRRARFDYGIPTIVPEIGGLGFGEAIETRWLEQNISGIMGNLKYLNMLKGEPDYCPQYLIIRDYFRVSPQNGGYLESLIPLERQATEIKKEEVLAKIYDPETFEVLEELKSPEKGILFYTCRSYMIRPGGWAFGVAKTENNNSRWFDSETLLQGETSLQGKEN